MIARRRLRTSAAVAALGAALGVPAVAGATTPKTSTSGSSTPTVTWLTDPVTTQMYVNRFGTSTAADGYGTTANTDASFGAWWLQMHGAKFGSGGSGKILSAAGKIVTLGAPYTWPTSAKADGGSTKTTPVLGYLAVWGKSAVIHHLDDSTFAPTATTTASVTTGHVGVVTGIFSNGAIVVSWADPTATDGITSDLVSAKETGLTYVHFAASHSTVNYTLALKNSTKADISVSVTPADIVGGQNQFTLPHGQTTDIVFQSFTNELTPVTVVLSRNGKKVASYAAAAGSTKKLTFTK